MANRRAQTPKGRDRNRHDKFSDRNKRAGERRLRDADTSRKPKHKGRGWTTD